MMITIDLDHGREHGLNIRQMVLYSYLLSKQRNSEKQGFCGVYVTAQEIAEKLPEVCRYGSENSAKTLLRSLIADDVVMEERRDYYVVLT